MDYNSDCVYEGWNGLKLMLHMFMELYGDSNASIFLLERSIMLDCHRCLRKSRRAAISESVCYINVFFFLYLEMNFEEPLI